LNVPVEVLAIMRERTGLDPDILGATFLERVWRRTLKSHASESACIKALAKNESSWTEMLDELVVPETWFFREEAAFAYLGNWLREYWQTSHTHSVFRALSLPCASGEEAYSIAITALESGLPAGRVQVDARDISPRAIAASQRGAYRGRSIRLIPRHAAEKYFKSAGEGLHTGEVLRTCTHFKASNVLHLNEGGAYPIVFCRNLLIYLSPEARQIALRNLQRAVAPEGVLFLGHGDCVAGLDELFERLPVDGAFAYRHRTTKPAPVVRERSRTRSRILPAVRMHSKTLRTVRPVRAVSQHDSLRRAQTLADEGSLDEARKQLIPLLKEHNEFADAWYLLGLVQSALGHTDEAELCYERTLALQPSHKEAVLHRALLGGERPGGAK